MAIITAYKCLSTGVIFESEKEYKKHRRKEAKKARDELVRRRSVRKYAGWLDQIRNTEGDIETILAAFLKDQAIVWAFLRSKCPYDFGGGHRPTRTKAMPEILSISVERLFWSDSVSNSHNCPVGGITNWGNRKEGEPLGYPGWKGRLAWKVKTPKNIGYPGSIFFRDLMIHTGCGGGGDDRHTQVDAGFSVQNFGYDIEIFAHDWPGLYRAQCLEMEVDRRIEVAKKTGFRGPFDRAAIRSQIALPFTPAPLPPLTSNTTTLSKKEIK